MIVRNEHIIGKEKRAGNTCFKKLKIFTCRSFFFFDQLNEGMLTAAMEDTTRGWVVHPLNGKIPILPRWQRLQQTPPDIEDHIKKGCNETVFWLKPYIIKFEN